MSIEACEIDRDFSPQSAQRRDLLKILVADDAEASLALIAHQCRRLGYDVAQALDGRAALEQWRLGGVALLMTDLRMPRLDGYQLATAIRAEELPGAHLPIIAITANASVAEKARCHEAGIDSYLLKPVLLDDMRIAIEISLGLVHTAPCRIAPHRGH